MIVQTILTLLALAATSAVVVLAIRGINKWRRHVERTDPDVTAQVDEKERQRALFVTKNLKTRVWRIRETRAATDGDTTTAPSGVGAGSNTSGEDVGNTTTNEDLAYDDVVSVPLGTTSNSTTAVLADEPSASLSVVIPMTTTTTAAGPSRTRTRRGHGTATTTTGRGAAAAAFMAARFRRTANRTNIRRGDGGDGGDDDSWLDVNNNLSSGSLDEDDDDSDNEENEYNSRVHSDLMDGTASSVVTAASSDRGTATDDEDAAAASSIVSGSLASSMARPSHQQQQHCAICSRSYRDGRDVVCDSNNPSCPHVFHAGCMKKWLLINPNCPLCRNQYLLNFAAKWRAGTTTTTAATTTTTVLSTATTTTCLPAETTTAATAACATLVVDLPPPPSPSLLLGAADRPIGSAELDP